MKHTLLTTLTIILLAPQALVAMEVAATQEDAARPEKLAQLSKIPARYLQITCCANAPANAYSDTDEVKAFQAGLLQAIDSIAIIPDAQGDQKSLTMNIEGIVHHPFFRQPVSERTRKLQVLEELLLQDSPKISIFNGETEYNSAEKKDFIIGVLSAVDALKQDARGLVYDLESLRRLPICKTETKQDVTTQTQSVPAQQPVEPTLRQKLFNPTTAAVALTCLAVGYMLRGQGTNQ